MYILIILIPFFMACISLFFGRFLGKFILIVLTNISNLICIFLALYIYYEVVICNSVTHIKLYNWITIDILSIQFGFLFDSLVAIMLLIITIISGFVQIYSLSYMNTDPHIIRFLGYLFFFTVFMEILVTSDNIIQLFIGWEGVGICSYLLINFWFTRILANKAALKAVIMNRISDVVFILAILLIINLLNTVDYLIIFNLLNIIKNESILIFNFEYSIFFWLSFFLVVGAIGKSAQIGLHTWLPDAMEGPTPVSALLHAATMVTAGVFLIIRFSFVFENCDEILIFITLVGSFTAFIFSIVAVFQYDIKKIIAYSTCSQLGYMFFACGLSQYQIAIFHLFNHAFFKALLFLGAGSVIHAISDEQDLRKMGSLGYILPFTCCCILIGSLAIMGIPFLTGFYSKDIILELASSRFLLNANFVFLLSISAAFFTAVYSLRLILFLGFWYNNSFRIIVNAGEGNLFMIIPMFFLAILSIIVGFIFSDFFIGWGTYSWGSSIYILPKNFGVIDLEFLHPIKKNLGFFFSLLGLFIVFFLLNFYDKIFYRSLKILKLKLNFIYNFFGQFFYNAILLNFIYNNLFLFIFKFSYKFTKILDKGFFELIGPFGFYKLFKFLSISSRKFSSNIISYNIFFVLLFFVLIFFFMFFVSFALPLWIIGLIFFFREI